MPTDPDLDPRSWVVAAGRPDQPGAPLNHPIVPASNFSPGGEFWYARSDGTATVDGFEEVIGGLQGGTAVAFASGMAVASALLDAVPGGGSVVIPLDCYHGVAALAEEWADQGRWELRRVDPVDTDGWVDALDADLVWIESPTNPLLEVVDLATVCGTERDPETVVAVDATFSTPLGVDPLRLGADVAMHSATKFIGGHSDLMLGVAVASRPDLVEALRRSRELSGATPGALETFLALRGVRTLALRLERMESNARVLVERLSGHVAVSNVRYPRAGAMVSFELAEGDEAADALCSKVRLIRHATSLGGVDTTLERRSGYPGSGHLPPGLIRMSVGIEAVEDLWADLAAALG